MALCLAALLLLGFASGPARADIQIVGGVTSLPTNILFTDPSLILGPATTVQGVADTNSFIVNFSTTALGNPSESADGANLTRAKMSRNNDLPPSN